jgi:hypothetical protein
VTSDNYAVYEDDTAGTLNVPKIKGVHQAIRCGVLAAEHLVETGDTAGFEARWRSSDGGRELKRVRNIKLGFHRGLVGLANAAPRPRPQAARPGRCQIAKTTSNCTAWTAPAVERGWVVRDLALRDRLAAVFHAGNVHDEHQRCTSSSRTRPSVRRAAPRVRQLAKILPANVYEWWTMAQARGDCRSTPRIACTARPATSGSLRHHHLDHARRGSDPTTRGLGERRAAHRHRRCSASRMRSTRFMSLVEMRGTPCRLRGIASLVGRASR